MRAACVGLGRAWTTETVYAVSKGWWDCERVLPVRVHCFCDAITTSARTSRPDQLA